MHADSKIAGPEQSKSKSQINNGGTAPFGDRKVSTANSPGQMVEKLSWKSPMNFVYAGRSTQFTEEYSSKRSWIPGNPIGKFAS